MPDNSPPGFTPQGGWNQVFGQAPQGGVNWAQAAPQQPAPAVQVAMTAEEAQMHAAIAQQEAAQMKRLMDKYPLLKITPVRPKRLVNMPAFKLEFDNLNDIVRRICRTLIFIGGELYYVFDIRPFEGDYMLFVQDADGEHWRCPYSAPEVNLRSPEPRYLQYGGRTAFYFRPPVRHQEQGLSRNNAYVKYFLSDVTDRAHVETLIKGFKKTDPTQWNETYAALMMDEGIFSSLRLSNSVAFGLADKGKAIVAEYKGRILGDVNENTVTVDENDYSRPWVLRDVSRIGCKLRREK